MNEPMGFHTNITIEGIDHNGQSIRMDVSLKEGSITENGHMRPIHKSKLLEEVEGQEVEESIVSIGHYD